MFIIHWLKSVNTYFLPFLGIVGIIIPLIEPVWWLSSQLSFSPNSWDKQAGSGRPNLVVFYLLWNGKLQFEIFPFHNLIWVCLSNITFSVQAGHERGDFVMGLCCNEHQDHPKIHIFISNFFYRLHMQILEITFKKGRPAVSWIWKRTACF